MKGIVSAYYDIEQEYDIPFQPNVSEAIKAFRSFTWRGMVEQDGGEQILMFNAVEDNNSTMAISCFDKESWAITISAVSRRRFFGPLFKKRIMRILMDLEQLEAERWITYFFEDTLEQLTYRLEGVPE